VNPVGDYGNDARAAKAGQDVGFLRALLASGDIVNDAQPPGELTGRTKE
jgi:hypothetical protein